MTRQDIEKLLMKHPRVRELYVVTFPRNARRKSHWAFVVLAKPEPHVIYDFHAHCAACFRGAAVADS